MRFTDKYVLAFALTLTAAATTHCSADTASPEENLTEDDLTRLDNITLQLGEKRGGVLRPTEGWHAYKFLPKADGYVRFIMQSPVGHATMWSYLRIEHEDPAGKKPWLHNTAGVGNVKSNTCEITMKVRAGERYSVITTSQNNLKDPKATRHVSDGPYSVSVMPVAADSVIPE
jgi:hypothetical protein